MNLASNTEIIKILNRYDKHHQKEWGHIFLVDCYIIHKIIEFAELSPEDYVIEIGPGIGVLTQEIAARSRGVLAIEIDSGMQQVLVETLAEYNNCHLVISDVLKVDLEQELSRSFALEKPTLYKV